MKNLILLLIGIFLISFACNEIKPPAQEDCNEKIDSVNKYWKDFILSTSNPQPVLDTIWTYKDSINWIYRDSLVMRYEIKDSIRWRDSIRYITVGPTPVDTIVIFHPDDPVMFRQEITFDSIRVSDAYYKMPGANLTDNDLTTRWGQDGFPHQVMFYFDGNYIVDEIWISGYGWDEGITYDYKIYNFSDLINEGVTTAEQYSKHKMTLYRGNHLYIDFTGSNKNDWTDIYEIKIFGFRINGKLPN